MRKCIFKLFIAIAIGIILLGMVIEVNATGLNVLWDEPEKYIMIENEHMNDGLVDMASIIVGLIKTAGIAISVSMLSIIGIKYIIGSVEERAEYKKTIWPYILGAIFIFLGANITDYIYRVFNP